VNGRHAQSFAAVAKVPDLEHALETVSAQEWSTIANESRL